MPYKSNILITLFCFIYSLGFSGEPLVLRGKKANDKIPGAELIRYHSSDHLPTFLKFSIGNKVAATDFTTWLTDNFQLNAATQFELLEDRVDPLGFRHVRYHQTYKGIPIEGMRITAHIRDGFVVSMSGMGAQPSNWNTIANLSKNEALGLALAHAPADLYRWQDPNEETLLKLETGHADASYFPVGQLVYIDPNGTSGDFKLAYKFDVYAVTPLFRKDIFVDALTGEVIFESSAIHTDDTEGTAVTQYSGQQTITTDSFADGFRLRETGRGNGIQTFDMNQGSSYGAAVDFVDDDNFWNNVNPEEDEFATDCHWAAEKTYDYFLEKHGRNSLDGNGFVMRSYVHYNFDFTNAFWDGQRTTYGDGGGNIDPLVTTDIVGHEFAHGLTDFTADLIYQNESGALNESFSDIFGTAIEFYAKPDDANWTVGEDANFTIRSMSNPNAFGDPDTYFGDSWYTGTGDNGGVHINSGVQNFWFYLLSVGGTGVNDLGNAYSVDSIGIDKAAGIAFRNLTVYLFPSATYEDARFYAIQSAIDLYGACSPEHAAVTNAWYAVGVGPAFSPEVVSDFTESASSACYLPFSTQFENLSLTASNFSWDFGDGSTSSEANPTHTYEEYGEYTVTLIADGGDCGADTLSREQTIVIAKNPAPEIENGSRCGPGSVMLSSNGTHSYQWYDQEEGGTPLHTGETYLTPEIASTTPYYVEEVTGLVTASAGPEDNSFGGGGFFNGFRHLVFDVYQPMTLVSVLVYANGTDIRTIELRSSDGVVLQSVDVVIPDGESRLTLNFEVNPGTDYQLGTTPGPSLFRNDDGAQFPYTVPGLMAITGTDASSPGYYYYFYDWEVKEPTCLSERALVNAVIETERDIEITPVSTLCEFSSPVDIEANEAGGTWSGIGIIDEAAGTFDPSMAGQGDHTITYSLPGACNDEKSFAIEVGKESFGDIRIAPNPNNGYFSVVKTSACSPNEFTLEVFDMIGNLVYDQEVNLEAGPYEKEFFIPHYSKGVYLVKLRSGDNEASERVVIY